MDRSVARFAVENLLERLAPTETGNFRLDGVITKKEMEALYTALAALGGTPSDGMTEGPRPVVPISPPNDAPTTRTEESGSKPRASAVRRPPPPTLVLNEARFEAKPDEALRLALDFGTARSKAFASKVEEGKREFLELALGDRARDETALSVTSSLWVSDDGAVFFGPRAKLESERLMSAERRRIDSLKDALSQGHGADGALGDPREIRLDPAANPTKVPFSEGDALLLYLAYLTDLAETEQAERYGLSRYLLRRFAIPCWTPKRRKAGEEILKTYLARAQVIADSVHGRWNDGLHIEDLKRLLDEAWEIDPTSLPTHLIGNGVPEPTAAAGSRVRRGEAQRGLVMVIDVGAGTTDFGLFLATENPDREAWKMTQLSAGRGTNYAGNKLDAILMSALIEQAHLGDQDRQRAIRRLTYRQRILKEDLFKVGKVQETLPGDDVVTMELQKFLELDAVRKFSSKLEDEFDTMVAEVDPTTLRSFAGQGLTVVATGGGASLPMIQALGTGGKNGLKRRLARDYPPGLSAALQSEYGQLAVALGAASDDVPELRDTPGPIDTRANPNMRPPRGFGG